MPTTPHRRVDPTRLIQALVLLVLGGIGAAAGFTHTHEWASAHGQTGWLAWADAVVIEGMAVVAGFEIHRDHASSRTPHLPAVVLVVAFLVQMTAQVAEAEPTPAGWLLAAMPALGFLTVVKLLLRRTTTAPAAEPAPVAGEPSQVQMPPAPAAPEPDHPATSVHPLPAAPVSAVLDRAPVMRRGGRVLGKLPSPVRDTVTSLAHTAHQDGRPVTPDDIRAAISLPDTMLADLVTELNTTVDGHPTATR